MWETLKKWGGYIIGAGIFLLSIVAVLGRRKEEPKPDAQDESVLGHMVKEAAAQHDDIVAAQAAVVTKVNTPIPKTDSADIEAALKEWKDT